MPPTADPRVDAYIANAAAFAQPILRHLRDLVHRACPEVTETMKWSFPHFEHHGVLCSMAAFKAHCAFGFWHQGMSAVLGAAAKSEDAMGDLGRITSLADLPSEAALRRFLKAAVRINQSGAPARPAVKPRAELPTPADLTFSLKKNPAARATWEKFPPSHRREYIEWLTEAKRPETRAKRLATTLDWLTAGRERNWKYR